MTDDKRLRELNWLAATRCTSRHPKGWRCLKEAGHISEHGNGGSAWKDGAPTTKATR